MNSIFNALAEALASLFHPKMLALVLWPLLLSFFIWGGLAFWFWQDWVAATSGFLASTSVDGFLLRFQIHGLAATLGVILAWLLVLPCILITALLVASVIAMPVMVKHVAARDFPALEKKAGGTVIGSVWNALVAVLVFLVLWVITLPLWLFGLPALMLPVLLAAYLNQRLFRYDALAEHASREEFGQILERAGGRLYVLGAALGLIQFIPVVNLFSPIYIGLAFTHFCLDELRELRAALFSEQSLALLPLGQDAVKN
ncbi:MAG: EI24 domain-containing protein [Burkholderiales bacterium]